MKRRSTVYDIKVTKALLDKKESERSELENEAVKLHEDYKNKAVKAMNDGNEFIRKHCPVLVSGLVKYPIPSPGWTEPIKKYCLKLEDLNQRYAKYGIAVNISESKTKFATLRFSPYVFHRGNILERIILYPWLKSVDILRNIDYGRKYNTISPYHKTVEWEEIDKEEFDSRSLKFDYDCNRNINKILFDSSVHKIVVEDNQDQYIADVLKIDENANKNKIYDLNDNIFFKEENGKYYRSFELWHSAKTEMIITKHKFAWKLFGIMSDIKLLIEDIMFKIFNTKNIELHREIFNDEVFDIVNEMESECEKYCEECGTRFSQNSSWNDKYTTHGWIEYLCKRCATASGRYYVQDNSPKTTISTWFKDEKEANSPYENNK